MANTRPAASDSQGKLPSYEEAQAERDMKEAFAGLIDDHSEIQDLFKSVASQLENEAKIGDGNALCTEWNQLRQRHRVLYKDSQLNASQCASFLNNFHSILVPLSRSRMTFVQKKLMIDKFVEAIGVHQEAARKTAEGFSELCKSIEGFPLKVSAFLRSEADSGNFLYNLWSGIGEICMSIWSALNNLLAAIARTFRNMLSRIHHIRFSCGPFVRLDLEMSEASRLSDNTPSATDIGQAKLDCKDIADRLNGFEDAWHMVRLACTQLLDNVSMARGVSNVPRACEENLKMAETVYVPLVQCLRAYATGKSPLALS